MGIGVSIFLVAVGAILAFAVEINTEGIDLNTVGVILMILGIVGLIAAFVMWNDWQPRRRIDVYEDRPVTRRRTGAYDDDPVVEHRGGARRSAAYDDRR